MSTPKPVDSLQRAKARLRDLITQNALANPSHAQEIRGILEKFPAAINSNEDDTDSLLIYTLKQLEKQPIIDTEDKQPAIEIGTITQLIILGADPILSKSAYASIEESSPLEEDFPVLYLALQHKDKEISKLILNAILTSKNIDLINAEKILKYCTENDNLKKLISHSTESLLVLQKRISLLESQAKPTNAQVNIAKPPEEKEKRSYAVEKIIVNDLFDGIAAQNAQRKNVLLERDKKLEDEYKKLTSGLNIVRGFFSKTIQDRKSEIEAERRNIDNNIAKINVSTSYITEKREKFDIAEDLKADPIIEGLLAIRLRPGTSDEDKKLIDDFLGTPLNPFIKTTGEIDETKYEKLLRLFDPNYQNGATTETTAVFKMIKRMHDLDQRYITDSDDLMHDIIRCGMAISAIRNAEMQHSTENPPITPYRKLSSHDAIPGPGQVSKLNEEEVARRKHGPKLGTHEDAD